MPTWRTRRTCGHLKVYDLNWDEKKYLNRCNFQNLKQLLPSSVTSPLEIREGDIFFALATFVSETGEAMNLVEGERVHVLEWNNDDWWYVRKHLTEEAGWVPAQYLKDEQTYTLYVQKKLVEKIEKLPVFDGKNFVVRVYQYIGTTNLNLNNLFSP